MVHLFIRWSFRSESRHCLSQTVRAKELKFRENVHPHHVSHVRCHMSGFRCQVSGVCCQVSGVTIFLDKKGGASRWSVCYQWGLPRLVSPDKHTISSINPRNFKFIDIFYTVFCALWSNLNLNYNLLQKIIYFFFFFFFLK